MTVIADDIVEAVAMQCGLSGLGLYTLLERRANAEGMAYGSYQDWADMSRMSRRQVIRVMDELVTAGFVGKAERTSRFGTQITNAWHLPFHQKQRTNGGDMGGDTTSDMGGDIHGDNDVTPKSSNKVVQSKNGTTPHPSGGPQGGSATRGTRIPEDFAITAEMRSWANGKGFGDPEIDHHTERFTH